MSLTCSKYSMIRDWPTCLLAQRLAVHSHPTLMPMMTTIRVPMKPKSRRKQYQMLKVAATEASFLPLSVYLPFAAQTMHGNDEPDPQLITHGHLMNYLHDYFLLHEAQGFRSWSRETQELRKYRTVAFRRRGRNTRYRRTGRDGEEHQGVPNSTITKFKLRSTTEDFSTRARSGVSS